MDHTRGEYQYFPLGILRVYKNTVDRFCDYFQVSQTSAIDVPDISEQLSISKFLQINSEYGIEGMARNVYKTAKELQPKMAC